MTEPAYNDTGLALNTTYSYQVLARDAASNTSSDSNEASATTLALFSPPTITELHAGQRRRRRQPDDQRHELHRGDGGQLQREPRELFSDLRHGDSGDCADGRHDGAAERDDGRRHGDQRRHFHGERGLSSRNLQLRRRGEPAL